MASDTPLTGEVSNSKAAAVFGTVQAAQQAGSRVRAALGLEAAQVQVLTPGERGTGRKLEPESHGIFRTLMTAHARLGLVGLVAGGLLFALLYWLGVPWIVNSAALACGVFVVFGAIAGLMLGGLVTLRPDHDRYLLAVQQALKAGKSAVVVHAWSMEQRQQAEDALKAEGGEAVATL